QITSRMERVHMEAVAHFAGETRHPRVDAGDGDRDVWEFARARREEVRQQREAIEVAFEGERLALERPPDRPQREDVLPQLRRGVVEGHRETTLDVRLHLRAQAEREAAAARSRELPRGLRS